MAQIVIKEILSSDTITNLVEKINFNFDQITSGGGGPEGPIGPIGATGPSGVKGDRGSEWLLVNGSTEINQPSDNEVKTNDIRLDDLGKVYYWNSSWVDSGISIIGPAGPKGDSGDGSISIIRALPNTTNGYIIPNENDMSFKRLSDHLNLVTTDDRSSTDTSGIDYVLLGKGNNSLVLGEYDKMFSVIGTLDPLVSNWPTEEKDLPMLIISQNDYQDSFSSSGSIGYDDTQFKNGIAIGLSKTHSAYNSIHTPYQIGNWDSYTNLGIINRSSDFGISTNNSINLSSRTNKIRLSAGYTRSELISINEITDWSNLINVDSYMLIQTGDNLVLDATSSSNALFPDNKLILKGGKTIIESTNQENITNSVITKKNVTFVAKNNEANNTKNVANEIRIINNNVTEQKTRGDKYNNRTDTKTLVDTTNENVDAGFNLGTARITVDLTYPNDSGINLFYLGQSFDNSIIGYSGLNRYDLGSSINQSSPTDAVFFLMKDNPSLGYNVFEGITIGFTGNDALTDKSLTRLGIFPGFFNKRRLSNGTIDSTDTNSRKNLEMYLDEGHKKLPTGSLDLWGTVRIREYGLAENKTGYIAINAGHGIVKWEEESKVGLGTGAIVMASDFAMQKFNAFTYSPSPVGTTDGTDFHHVRFMDKLSTQDNVISNKWSAALPGKGFDEWSGYYLCNGAVLADSRDIFARGFFSTVNSLTAYGSDNQPQLLVENPHFTQYSLFSSSYNIKSYSPAETNVTTATADDFKANYINHAKSVITYYGNDGLSLLAPRNVDSGFRVVLPNYYGRFPKQITPDSSVLVNSSNYDSTLTPVGGKRVPSLSYYKVVGGKSYYNTKWQLSGMFKLGGSDYIKQNQLPIHNHYVGNIASVNSILGGTNALRITHYNTGSFGTDILSQPIPSDGYTTGTGSHGLNTNGADTAPNVKEDYMAFDSNSEVDVYSTSTLTKTLNFFSNYIPKDYSQDLLYNYTQISQKFFSPMYKGTNFVIKLRGLRNPDRNNTIVPDLDFIAGVPYAGINYKNSATNKANSATLDLSWYNDHTLCTQYCSINTSGHYAVDRLEVVASSAPGTSLHPTLGSEALGKFEKLTRDINTNGLTTQSSNNHIVYRYAPNTSFNGKIPHVGYIENYMPA